MKLRVARHTHSLKKSVEFYLEIIGLTLLGEFKDHDGYDGIFLGYPDSDWHLEFTCNNQFIKTSYDEESPLVFYPCNADFHEISRRIETKNLSTYQHPNPYWNKNGICLKDYDGQTVIINKNTL